MGWGASAPPGGWQRRRGLGETGLVGPQLEALRAQE